MESQKQIKRGIRWKLLTTMIGLIVGLVAILTYVHITGQKENLEKALDRRIELMRKVLVQRGKTLTENQIMSKYFSGMNH